MAGKEAKKDTIKHEKTKAVKTNNLQLIKEACSSASKVSIFITQVDPDALGSAMMFRLYLINQLEWEASAVNIYYGGKISHPQNRAIFNLFELDGIMNPISPELEKEEGELWVLVDSNALDDKRVDIDLEPIDIIIDHHRIEASQKREDKLYYIKTMGSACTLVVDLVFPTKQDPDFTNISPEELARTMTLGSIGIRNDTHNFTSEMTKEADLLAFHRMMSYVDQKLATEAENYLMSDREFCILRNVLNSREVVGTRAIASAGYIYADDADQIAETANLLVKDSQVSLAVVWGIILEQGIVRLSFRSRNLSMNLDDTIKEYFGDSKGGAKQSKGHGEGGAILSLGDLAPVNDKDTKYKELLEKLIAAIIEHRVAQMVREEARNMEQT